MLGKKLWISLAIVAIAGILGLLMSDEVSGESATIESTDSYYYDNQEYYGEYDTIYFTIDSYDISEDYINVSLKDEYDYEIWKKTDLYLDSYGEGNGYYDYLYGYDYGWYTLEVEYNDAIIGSTQLSIIGDCNIYIEDEYNLYEGDELSFTVDLEYGSGTFNVYISDYWNTYTYKQWNNIDFPTSQFFTWIIPDYGSYYIYVVGSNYYDEIIDGYYFYAEEYSFYCDISIEEDEYNPGDTVKFTIYTYSGSENVDVSITDNKDKNLTNWKNQELSTGNPLELSYKLQDSITDGEYSINVFLTGSTWSIEQESFDVRTIELEITLDHYVYVPGATIKVYYSLSYIKTGQGVENGKYKYNVSYRRQRSSDTTYIEKDFEEAKSYGSFEVKLPPDAVPWYGSYITVTANDSADKYSSGEKYKGFYIAPPKVDVDIITKNSDPEDKEGNPLYSSGDFMVVRISSQAGNSEYWYGYEYVEKGNNNYCVFYEDQDGEYDLLMGHYKYKLDGKDVWLTDSDLYHRSIYSSSPLAESTVNIEINKEIEKNEEYESSGMSAKGLSTDLTGNVYYIFEFEDIESGLYTVNGSITSISGFPAKLTNGYKRFSFQKTKSMLLITKIAKDVYKPGETVNINYTLSYIGGGDVDTVTFDYVVSTGDGTILDKGRFTSGDFSFYIPENIDSKTIDIILVATNDTAEKVYSTLSIYVTSLQVLLNTVNYEYSPGDTLSFDYKIVGSGGDISSYYKIIGGFGYEEKTLENNPIDSIATYGKILFNVPKIGYAEYYTIAVYSIDDSGHYVERTATVFIKEYQIFIEFDKDSYKPGDSVTFSYKIEALTDKTLEGPFRIIYDIGGLQSGMYESMSANGNVTFNLTENITEGFYIFTLDVGFASNQEEYSKGIEIKKKEDKGIYGKYTDIATPIAFPIAIIGLILVIFFLTKKGRDKGFPQEQQFQPPYETPSKEPAKPQYQTQPEQLYQPQYQPPPEQPYQPQYQPPPPQQSQPSYQPPPEQQIQPPGGTLTQCPKCGSEITITTTMRPVNIKCPKCGLEGLLE